MKRFRLAAAALALVAALAAALAITSPAYADTGGPVQNYGNGLCPTPEGNWSGALVRQQPCDQYTTGVRNLMQEWDGFCQNSNCTVFHYVNRGSQLCLRARGTGPANGLQIMLWDCNWISDVNWAWGSDPVPGTFVLESRISGSSGYCLDVPGASWSPGLALQLYRCNQTVAQIWQQPTPIIE